MPYEKGGRADKEGNKFEIKWVLLQLLNILMENIEYIALESLGEDEKGVDLWIGKKDGTREGQQCKARNGSKEYWDYSSLNSKDILTNWKHHLERDQDISVSLVSPLSFTFLEDLNKRALNSSEDSKTFYKYQIEPSSKSFKNFYKNILSSLNISSEKDSFKIINYLKRIMYHQIPDSTLDDIIFHYMDCLFKSDKDTVYDSFISWVISGEIIGKRVDIDDIYDFLNNKNIYLRDLANDQRIFPRINQLNREYRDTFKSIQDNLKIRSIFETCKNRLIKGDSLIIHGKAGVGKSGLTMNIIDYCIDERIPYLALKLDNRIPKNNAEQWGSDIGLPASIPFCIDSLSKNKRVVLILDQLDILRWTQSHSREALLICKEIINQIEKINKDRDNKISLIFVCRTFDLENDNNFKSLFENSGENNDGMNWARIQVEEFDDLTVKQIVGPRYNKITSKLKTLLRTPSNLYIWSQLDIRSNYAECSTTNHLITEWWNQLSQNAHRNQLNTRELENTKKELVNWLEKNNRIYAPLKVLHTGQAYLDFLTSNSFLNIENSKISFAHQSILDCLLAEEMLNNYYKGYEITQIIGEKNKQTPVRRYQLQIFLELLLEYDSADFIRVGVQIFESDNIRYFFKYVFLEILSQIDNIDENIKLFILNNCENKIFELLLIKYVYINKPKYIDLLISENIFNKWLLNSELKKYVYILLESINTSHTIISTNFIKENLFNQREDEEMFISCFPYDIKFDLDSLFDLRMEFYEKYPHFVNPYIDFLDLLESHEMRAIRLLELIIRKKQNIKGEKLYIDNEKVFNKKNYGIKEERKILDFLIPLIPIENGISQFSEWSEYTSYEKGIERFCIKIIKEANINLIKSDPNEFWEYYNNYMGKGYDLFNEILLDGFKYLPKNFSNKVIEYLILDFENNIFICTDGSGNQLSLFKQNIYKHMATCDQEIYDRSLKKINEYMPNDILSRYKSRLIYSMENNVKVYWNFCEDFQKEIYEALPYSRLSSSDRRKKLALQRKFPNKTRYDISNKIYSGIVISPIKKKIKVKQWLDIFTNKKILNRNPLHWSESFIDNSINGFADSFRDSVSENPSELIRLVIEYKDFINNKYIDSLFSGVANSDNVKNTPVNLLVSMMTDLKYDYNSNRASDICRIIRKMDYRFIPAELINILNDIALNHTNPQDNKINITKKDDENMTSYEMLISNALNCSRSEAIRTIGEIIYENKSLFIDFRETILKVSEDKNPAVRLACLFALWPSYNIDQKWAEKIILKLYIDDYRLLGFEDSNKMLFNLYQNNKKEVIKLIKKCFKSDDKDLIRIGGHGLCIMNILYNEFTDIIGNICDLNENQKRSILEMSILYFKLPQYNNNSKKIILKIVQNSNGMHISLSSLFSKENINLERDKEFLIELIKIIPNNRIMYSFIRYLENESLTLIDYEEIIFSMAYSLLESPNEENKIWRVENEISQLVIGLYDETCNSNNDKLKSISEKCLDLWDLMFENQIGNIRMLSEKIMER